MTKNQDRLILRHEFKNGRVLAVNTWGTGSQMLVYPNRKAFEEAKLQVEQQGYVPNPTGFAPV